MGDNYRQVYTYIFYSVGIGVLIGVVYDVFRIIRIAFTVPGIVGDEYRGVEHRSRYTVDLIVFLCDILFFVIDAVISAIFIFYANNGRIRGIALFGSLVGFAAYYNTVGRLVTLISASLIRLICRIIHFVRVRVLLPALMAVIRGIGFLFSKVTHLEKKLYTHRQTRRIIRKLK